jgi:DNA uptake protein ComE-like DNA-binding protein
MMVRNACYWHCAQLFRFVSPLLAVALFLLLQPAAHAYSLMQNYIPPEVLHGRHLKHRVAIPDKVNINRAELSELQTLPGLDEALALKIIRLRPFSGLQDLRRIPMLSPPALNRLMDRYRDKITF